jgi:hypothetical protein
MGEEHSRESSQPMPPDPISVLTESAAQLHELFTVFMKAGFTEPQAMRLVTATLTASLGQKGH